MTRQGLTPYPERVTQRIWQVAWEREKLLIAVALSKSDVWVIKILILFMSSGSDINVVNNWFALQTRLRHERFVGSLLSQKGVETFVPLCLSDGGRSSRQASLSESVLFPGYVFARFDVMNRLPVLKTPGVYAVVGHGKTPVAIPESEIIAVRHAVINRMEMEPCSYLSVGSRVRVVNGPLANYEGILIESRSLCRVVLSISAIQRSVRVQVDRNNVVLLEAGHSCLSDADRQTA